MLILKSILILMISKRMRSLYGGLTKNIRSHYTSRRCEGAFFSYGYNKEKSSLFYCSMKTPLPNIFNCTAFKKHLPFLFDENQKKAQFSNMLLFLPSTLARKEDVLKWKDYVHSHPIDFDFDDLKEITGIKEMNPFLLNNKNLRGEVTGAYYKLMKKMAEISNKNLIQHSDAYISTGGKIDPDNKFSWIYNSYKSSKEKFQLNC